MVPYITSKLTQFTANDIMRPIIAQQKSSFNITDAEIYISRMWDEAVTRADEVALPLFQAMRSDAQDLAGFSWTAHPALSARLVKIFKDEYGDGARIRRGVRTGDAPYVGGAGAHDPRDAARGFGRTGRDLGDDGCPRFNARFPTNGGTGDVRLPHGGGRRFSMGM
jgi:hypothetical protein